MQNASSQANTVPFNPLSAVQRIRPDLLGFVFHLSWMYLLLFSDAVVRSRTSNLVSVTDPAYLASAAALAIALIVGIMQTRRFMSFCEGRFCVIFAPAAMTVGTVMYCVVQFCPSEPLMYAGGILTGVGSAMMAARWASVFGGASPRTVVENLPTLLAVIVVICASVRFVPYEALLALVVIMPILSGVALRFARRYQAALSNGKQNASAGEGKTRAALGGTKARSGLYVLAMVAFVALMGFTISMMPAMAAVGFDNTMLFYIFSGALVLVFTAVFIARYDTAGLFMLFCVPVLVLIAALLPLVGSGMRSFGAALQPAGNIAFELLLLFGTVLMARIIDASPARMFMIGRLTMTLFDLLGAFAGKALTASADSAIAVQTAGVMLFCSCELVLVGILVAFLYVRGPVSAGRNAFAAAAAGSVDSANLESTVIREEPMSQAAAGRGAVSGSDDPTVEPGLPSEGASSESDTVSSPCVAEVQEDPVEAAADEYGLSERERDVLRLLAEGRTSSRIQEELCIAAGTVNYHTRNIYSKMGVHSRQQLIDLVHRK